MDTGTSFPLRPDYARQTSSSSGRISGPGAASSGSGGPSFREPSNDNDSNSDEARIAGAATGNGPVRRIACDVCRERKVRCDRKQPKCGRCQRLGHKCRYTISKRQDAPKLDVPQALLTLHSRLAQAEAQLALNQSVVELGQATAPWPGSDTPVNFEFKQPDIYNQAPPCSATKESSYEPLNDFGFEHLLMDQALEDWQRFVTDGDMGMIMAPPNQNKFSKILDKQPFNSSPSFTFDMFDLEESFPPHVISALHQTYFDVIHQAMPMINRDRFSLALSTSPMKPHLSALNYAVAMLGTSLSDEYAHLEEKCYQYARKYLEIAERQDENFVSLEALQACVLTTWQEFKGPGFVRAWMSLGRAVRLAKILGLHEMDRHGPARGASVLPISGFQLPLPGPKSPAELEERRRTFWVLFVFEAYASVRTGSPTTIQEVEISTALPSLEFPGGGPELLVMPSLDNVTTLSGTGLISPFAGVVLMISLYCRCLKHFQASYEQDQTGDLSYGFWLYHYQIDKTVADYSTNLLGHLTSQARLDDPLALCLNMNLCAVNICLHQAAIEKAQKGKLPLSLIAESENRCTAAAMEIVGDVRLSQRMDVSKGRLLREMTTFVMWPLSMAARVLSRQLKTLKGDSNGTVTSLLLLRSTMEDLKDPSGHWNDLLGDIALQLADTGITKKRKRVEKSPLQGKEAWEEQT